nr:hypothetical protein [Maliibacterium massiliense]
MRNSLRNVYAQAVFSDERSYIDNGHISFFTAINRILRAAGRMSQITDAHIAVPGEMPVSLLHTARRIRMCGIDDFIRFGRNTRKAALFSKRPAACVVTARQYQYQAYGWVAIAHGQDCFGREHIKSKRAACAKETDVLPHTRGDLPFQQALHARHMRGVDGAVAGKATCFHFSASQNGT